MVKKDSKTTTKKPKAKIGRPTKYNEEMVKKAYDYIDFSLRDLEELPTLFKMAQYLEIDEDTVLEWGKIHEHFSGAIKKVKKLQKGRLMEKGLDGTWSTPMAIFLLKANHGLVDRQVVHNVDTPENKVESLLNKLGE